jgi:molecular chaperone DnaK (HSP70)
LSTSYIVGIDLGTTNSALAATELSQPDLAGSITCVNVEQLIAPAEIASKALLPSSMYLLEGPELPKGSTKLPWTKDDLSFVVGEFAREQGAKVPGRLVQSAKSWLCHPGVDRNASILPWGADDWVQKQSPVKASAAYLSHLRDSWNYQHPNAPLEEQEIILTVPASFDDVARNLTLEAAKLAKLSKVKLLEEPQAAFYSFLLSHRESLQKVLSGVRVVLVVDVGGGTSDFSLIEVIPSGAVPKAQRIAVGDHILLGGDNIDQALARRIEGRTIGEGKLDGARFWQLVQACRLAKESMLSPGGPNVFPIKILARGSRLLGGTLSAELTKEEVISVVLEGFFPVVPFGTEPIKPAKSGLKELGLPYAADPAIPKHLSAFLQQHPEAIPDAILLNGGVLTPDLIKQHLVSMVRGWFPEKQISLLETFSLDLAVARGACAYGLTKRGVGISIGGGSARGYYAGIEVNQKPMGLCLAPKGSEENLEIAIDRGLSLRVGRPVRFPLFTSNVPRKDAPGDVVSFDDSFRPLPPIQTVLDGGSGEIPVQLVATITEVGTLSLSLAQKDGAGKWQLEFQLAERSSMGAGSAAFPQAKLQEAFVQIQKAFGPKSEGRDARNLGRVLEKIFGRARAEWPTGLCRELFDSLREHSSFRRASLDAEAGWLNMAGFLLRPGFGQHLDDWRVKELWKLYFDGIAFRNERRVRLEWWILWRRVAGGLPLTSQEEVHNAFSARMRSYGQEPIPADPKQREEQSRDQEIDEVIRLAANLERLPETKRAELGNLFLQRAETWGAKGPLLWAVGRLGARVLFYGSGHEVIRRAIVERWVKRVLAFDWKTAEGASFAAAHLSRRTGDRDTDLDEDLREEVAKRLESHQAPAVWVQMVREITALEAKDQQQVFGESLPAGLRLSE